MKALKGFEEALTKQWKDKQFVYKSKYGGETIGVVGSVIVSYESAMDNETEDKLRELRGNNKYDELFARRDIIKNKEYNYYGFRPTVKIESTTGMKYNLDEIYILVVNKM